MVEDCQKQVHNVEFLGIEDIKIDEKERIRTTSGQVIEDLKESIDELGLFHPILINKDNKLIAGYRRLTACKKLGWNIIPAFRMNNINEMDKIKIELQENIMRKNLSPYEIDIGLAKLKRMYETIHPETVHLAQNTKKEISTQKVSHSSMEDFATYINESSKEDSKREKRERAKRFTRVVAEYSNYSERTIRDRVQVGTATLKKKYDNNTIQLYKTGEITHSEMLKRDRIRRSRERKQRKARNIDSLLEIEWCKDCKRAKISLCPDCGKQIIVCNKGYLVIRNIDAPKCEDFSKEGE